MFLVDTNVFLEIFLSQEKEETCKSFLDDNIGKLHVTDFSLHSIGVILFRYDKKDVFRKFAEDLAPNVKLLSLPMGLYELVVGSSENFKLDFDDAYQYAVARHYRLKVVTMDKDFEKIPGDEVLFL